MTIKYTRKQYMNDECSHHASLCNELNMDDRKILMLHQIDKQILNILQRNQKAIEAHKARMNEFDESMKNIKQDLENIKQDLDRGLI